MQHWRSRSPRPTRGSAPYWQRVCSSSLPRPPIRPPAGAIQRLLGNVGGRAVDIGLVLVQVVVCGAAYASSASIWGHLSAFMPMSYTAAGASEIGYGQVTSTGWLAIGLTVALLAVSGIVYRTLDTEPGDSEASEELADYA
ncbi:hypothetical protein [Rhodococcus sp. 1168]|uniref:hypothetical protein n=1 Tax=Rhodococcus sp. 1168 TaxID=2018041 RepID=UPI0020CB0708|nr:hypothetical protein [Rhodococcus sp. 1168]